MNLFDIMRQAGGGNAFSALGQQYGLTEEQIRRAMEAFLPAFSAGLKQSTADPFGLMQLMQRLGAPDYTRAYRNPDWAAGAGRPEGEAALAFLFGSPEAARGVAEQASRFTGLALEKLNELLPAMTAMMFGGLAEQSRRANPMFDAMLRQFHTAAPDTAPKGPLDRYEDEQAERESATMADMAEAQRQAMAAGIAAFQTGAAAWQKAMADMMKNADTSKAQPTGEASGSGSAGANVFGEMFEPGLRLSEAYQREMEAMLDRLRPKGGAPH